MVINVENILSSPKITRTQLSNVYKELKKLNIGIKWVGILRKSSRQDVISTYKQATQKKKIKFIVTGTIEKTIKATFESKG